MVLAKVLCSKILAGKEQTDEGALWIHKDVTVALFEQEPKFEEDKNGA